MPDLALKGDKVPRKAATSPAMRSMRGLARRRCWVRRCRRGAITIRRYSHRYWRSTAIIGEPNNGVSERTLVRDVETARAFLEQLRSGRTTIARARLTDVDAFVRKLATRLSRRTIADTCSSLRRFLRFLRITGRLTADLVNEVVAPRYRIDERPPRCLPWSDVQKILRAISRTEAPGQA